MKKKIGIVVLLIILIFIIIISFFNNKDDYKELKKEVNSYLKDKYNEDFSIEEVSRYFNNYYDEESESSVNLKKSYIYNMKVRSSRLDEFELYVVKNDKDEYLLNKDKNIFEDGIYENYIYIYKCKSIKNEIKDKVKELFKNNSLSVSFDYISEDDSNVLFKKSLYTKSKKDVVDNYLKINKKISNIDFYKEYKSVVDNINLIITINSDVYIGKNNIDDFKDSLKEFIIYLEDLGYYDYDINFNLSNYESARVTRYENTKAYLIFDYEGYTFIEESDRMEVYIIDIR